MSGFDRSSDSSQKKNREKGVRSRQRKMETKGMPALNPDREKRELGF